MINDVLILSGQFSTDNVKLISTPFTFRKIPDIKRGDETPLHHPLLVNNLHHNIGEDHQQRTKTSQVREAHHYQVDHRRNFMGNSLQQPITQRGAGIQKS